MIRRPYFIAVVLAVSGLPAVAQQNVFNRSDSNTGEWGSANLPWFYQLSNTNLGDPDNGGGTRNDVFIGHNNFTSMSLNGRFYNVRDLTFQGGASSQRTLDNTANSGFSFSRSLINLAASTHIFNSPVRIDGNNAEIKVTQASSGLTFNGSIFTNGNSTFLRGLGTINITGVISQAGTVTKEDSGVLILSGSNTYTGSTNVSGGTLQVNGNQSGATGAVTVASSAKLSGSGTVGGATTISGVHGAGNALGSQTFSNALTYNAGSIFEWELGSQTTSGRGTAFDAVNVGGALSVSDSVFKVIVSGLDITSTFWDTPILTWDVFDKASIGTFSAFQLFAASDLVTPVNYASEGAFSFDTAIGDLRWTAVPEPTSALAGLLLAAGLMRRRR